MKSLVGRNNDSSKIVDFDFELSNLYSARCKQNIEDQVILCTSAKSRCLQILPHMDSKLSECRVRLQRYIFVENGLIFFVIPQNLSGSSSCVVRLLKQSGNKTLSEKRYRNDVPCRDSLVFA